MTDASDNFVTPPMVTLIPLASERAPFIYFDGVITFGVNHGSVALELAANTVVPDGQGGTRTEVVVTAHIRCSPNALLDLKRSIDNVILLASPAQGQRRPADPFAKPN